MQRGARRARTPLPPWLHPGREAANLVGLDPDHQALLAGLAVRVLVRSEKSLGELIDVGVRAGLRQGGVPMDDHVRLRVVAVLDGDDDAVVTPKILRLL